MKASISFPELSNILLEKADQNISFGYVDDKTIHVTYPLNLGFIKSSISADLTIVELKGSDLLVQVSAGKGTETLINTALNLMKNKIPEGLLEKWPNNRFMIHLGMIDQVRPMFDTISVNNLHVLMDGLEVEGAMKSVNNNI
jgi:hypothetical protein